MPFRSSQNFCFTKNCLCIGNGQILKKYRSIFKNSPIPHDKVEVIRNDMNEAINEPGVVGIVNARLFTRWDLPSRADACMWRSGAFRAAMKRRLNWSIEALSYVTLCLKQSSVFKQVPKAEVLFDHGGFLGRRMMMVENIRRCVTDNEVISSSCVCDIHGCNRTIEGDFNSEPGECVINDQLEIIPKHIVILSYRGRHGICWLLYWTQMEVLTPLRNLMRRRGEYPRM